VIACAPGEVDQMAHAACARGIAAAWSLARQVVQAGIAWQGVGDARGHCFDEVDMVLAKHSRDQFDNGFVV
jgi:hypothetical protein